MKQLSVMIKPASSLCNMRCRYCFYADVSSARTIPSYGLMSRETATSVIKNIFVDLQDGDSLAIAFQGGEPTLAGLDFYMFFVEEVLRQPAKVKVSWALQTNGLVLDEAWCTFLKKHHFLVGLSLDGYAALHNNNRLDDKQHGTYSQVMRSKQLMDKCGVEYNILCVLTNETARYPQKIWKFILDEHIRYIQFIPCLDELNAETKSPWALQPKRFHSFYAALASLWEKEVQRGNYVSVKLFDDIVNLYVRGQVTACGFNGQCQPQFVIEADGGVYPCDFYVLDEYRSGSLTDTSIKDTYDALLNCGFLHSRKQLPAPCAGCRYLKACGGGCKRMQGNMYVDADGFCGFRQLLDDRLDELCRAGSMLLGRR